MAEELTFEQAIATLDQVIAALSKGDVPLDEAVETYKKGLSMAAFCQSKIKDIEGELKILKDGQEQSFSIGEDQ